MASKNETYKPNKWISKCKGS